MPGKTTKRDIVVAYLTDREATDAEVAEALQAQNPDQRWTAKIVSSRRNEARKQGLVRQVGRCKDTRKAIWTACTSDEGLLPLYRVQKKIQSFSSPSALKGLNSYNLRLALRKIHQLNEEGLALTRQHRTFLRSRQDA